MKSILTTLLLLLLTIGVYAQLTQTIRGQVVDQVLQTPLAGATVTLQGSKQTSITDQEGQFKLHHIPVGTHQIQVSYVGYKPATLSNLQVITGKELVVVVSLEQAAATSEVVVKASNKRNKPLNDMSMVSARAFTVEETQKYAASVNDPLRMATNFAGIVSTHDGNNNIVIRGNAPNGLLWRMEGIDIPNPNHFSQSGSSGGGISILSSQLLSNSDFITGAFAAEYGNALSGVFDLKLRKGNNERREYAIQAGFLGLNLAAEGPFSKSGKASYLFNYRYSTLQLLGKMGVDVGAGATDFQDLSYNIYLPTRKAGTFTLFGFGGKSAQQADAESDSSKWEGEGDRYGWNYEGSTYATGATHQVWLGRRSMLRSALVYSGQKNRQQTARLDDALDNDPVFDETSNTKKLALSSTLHHKFNAQHALRSGIIITHIGYHFDQYDKANLQAPLTHTIDAEGSTQTIQAFSQWQGRWKERFTMNAGLHFLTLTLNNSYAVEPRASIRYQINQRSHIALGYGMHSQAQSMGVCFGKPAGTPEGVLPNKNLGFTKSDHYVLSHQWQWKPNLRIKTEAYYQRLHNIPVANSDTSTLATINVEGGFITDALVNKGTGRNYGIEVSLERYLHQHFYFMWSNSIYQSKYTALDGIERNTRFNGNYVTNLVAGKDFVNITGRRTIGLNIKLVYAGGLRQTPIDTEASADRGYTVYIEKRAFEQQLPAYFRTDIRASISWNRKRSTSTLSLDLQNVSNRQNVFANYYDNTTQQMKTAYQAGLIPVLNYKIEF